MAFTVVFIRYVCIKFASIVNFFARGKITMVGHYSNFGKKIREEILDDSALEMFWFIDENTASGGRAALLPLIKSIFSSNSVIFSSSKHQNVSVPL